MKKEYDFSKAKRNPYAKRLKKQITIRLDRPTIDYFKGLAEEIGPIPDLNQSLSPRLCRQGAETVDVMESLGLRAAYNFRIERTWPSS
jgi:hypothetical protein